MDGTDLNWILTPSENPMALYAGGFTAPILSKFVGQRNAAGHKIGQLVMQNAIFLVRFHIADCYDQQKQWKKAKEMYESLLQSPDLVPTLRASILRQMGRLSQVSRIYLRF